MTIKDLLEQDIDIDVVDDIDESLWIAFVGPQKLTAEGEAYFAPIMGVEVTIENDEVAVIHLDGVDFEKARHNRCKTLFHGAAGYISQTLYDQLFVE